MKLSLCVASRCIAVLAFAVLTTTGCEVTESASMTVSCGPAGCTYAGTGSISIKQNVNAIPASNLSAAVSSGYITTIHVPTNELTPVSNGVTQATLQATTDTGYTSSIVVDLQPAGSAPSTLYSGYTAYTFSVPSSTALTNWVAAVNAHTTSTSNVTSTTNSTFTVGGITGTYSVYAQVTSSQSDPVNTSASFSDIGTGREPGCTPGKPCTN